jgi:hypothetical protein
MTEKEDIDVDWKRVVGFLLMMAGVIGSVGAIFYIWCMQMLLRYARDSMWDGIWFFALCFAVLLASTLAGFLGLKMFCSRNG